MQKEPLLPHLPPGKDLVVVLWGGNLIGLNGVGDIVVVDLGTNAGCKGRLDGGGMVREEEGGQKR